MCVFVVCVCICVHQMKYRPTPSLGTAVRYFIAGKRSDKESHTGGYFVHFLHLSVGILGQNNEHRWRRLHAAPHLAVGSSALPALGRGIPRAIATSTIPPACVLVFVPTAAAATPFRIAKACSRARTCFTRSLEDAGNVVSPTRCSAPSLRSDRSRVTSSKATSMTVKEEESRTSTNWHAAVQHV